MVEFKAIQQNGVWGILADKFRPMRDEADAKQFAAELNECAEKQAAATAEALRKHHEYEASPEGRAAYSARRAKSIQRARGLKVTYLYCGGPHQSMFLPSVEPKQ